MEKPGYIKNVQIRFYAELNDFIRKGFAGKPIDYSFKGTITVKDAIESLGVPHSSVDLVLVNSEPVGFDKILRHGDYVSVYPVFETFDISGIKLNNRKPLRVTRFVVDAHLGRLARNLRMLGFDSVYYPGITDENIINLAEAENRIILTRDKALLKLGRVTHGYYVRATNTHDQLTEVIAKFDLSGQFDPFSRCLVCNGLLEEVDPQDVKDQLPTDTFSIFKNFFRCGSCQKIYWEGSHYEKMREKIGVLSGKVD